MHALNHLYDAPVVNRSDCKAVAREFARRTRQPEEDHLLPETGWLSIEIMNILALTRPDAKHIEEAPRKWTALQAEVGVAAMVNWNQSHWTVLKLSLIHI